MTSEQIDELEKLEKLAETPTPSMGDRMARRIAYSDALRNAAPALIAAARENARLRAVVEAARELCQWVRKGDDFNPTRLDSSHEQFGDLDELVYALSALDAKGVE